MLALRHPALAAALITVLVAPPPLLAATAWQCPHRGDSATHGLDERANHPQPSTSAHTHGPGASDATPASAEPASEGHCGPCDCSAGLTPFWQDQDGPQLETDGVLVAGWQYAFRLFGEHD